MRRCCHNYQPIRIQQRYLHASRQHHGGNVKPHVQKQDHKTSCTNAEKGGFMCITVAGKSWAIGCHGLRNRVYEICLRIASWPLIEYWLSHSALGSPPIRPSTSGRPLGSVAGQTNTPSRRQPSYRNIWFTGRLQSMALSCCACVECAWRRFREASSAACNSARFIAARRLDERLSYYSAMHKLYCTVPFLYAISACAPSLNSLRRLHAAAVLSREGTRATSSAIP